MTLASFGLTHTSGRNELRQPAASGHPIAASVQMKGGEGKAMIAEPTFIASVDGLCGFILVVGEGEVDAYTPAGEWLGVFQDRVEAAEAVVKFAKRGPER
jgi:hypothetical protein